MTKESEVRWEKGKTNAERAISQKCSQEESRGWWLGKPREVEGGGGCCYITMVH